MSTAIPVEYLCPISLQLMKDPVIGPDGHTYEREAIEHWLSMNNVSPMTRQRMYSTTLTPNIALRSAIDTWISTHPQMEAMSAAPFKDIPLQWNTAVINAPHDTRRFLHMAASATGEEHRQPLVLICIVDNSGSMGEQASAGEGLESFGYTRLDLVKHTIRTVAAILGSQDSLAIVTFSTAARVVVAPTSMNEAGRSRINAALDTINPDSQTNIWDGIRQASVLANAPELAGRNIVGALLTDGFPNVNPPRGILPTLQTSIKMKNPWSLHTFGFGYKLDSKLLAEIANWGSGLFGFIPDCSMVGTVFINFVANMLSTASRGETLYYKIDSTVATHKSGAVQHGQTRNWVVPIGTATAVSVSIDGITYTPVELSDGCPKFEFSRWEYLQIIESLLLSEGRDMRSLADFNELWAGEADVKVKALLQDTDTRSASEGQVAMAPRFWGRWGEHYLRSYAKAQELQQSMNFKDPGLQIYGGSLFKDIQTKADTIFCTLPAPTPSTPPALRDPWAVGGGPAMSAAPATMATFHNPSGGCFAPESLVLMSDGTRKAIKNIMAGEHVMVRGTAVPITAVVVCDSNLRSQPMCQIGSLCITPWHPILEEGIWVFPAEVVPYNDRLIQTVYNFVLPSGHIVDVDGVECCTLGHGFTEPKVAHDFFGSQRVLDCLKKLPGWSVGRPTFINLTTVRDVDTGMIMEWIDSP